MILGIDIGTQGALNHASLFAKVKDDGRAEAALIAVAGLARIGHP